VQGIFSSIEGEMPRQIKFPTSKNVLKDPLRRPIEREVWRHTEKTIPPLIKHPGAATAYREWAKMTNEFKPLRMFAEILC